MRQGPAVFTNAPTISFLIYITDWDSKKEETEQYLPITAERSVDES